MAFDLKEKGVCSKTLKESPPILFEENKTCEL
jgi:hypothetical protein